MMTFNIYFRAFIVSLGLLKTIRVYKINKKKDEGNSSIAVSQEFDFPSQHKGDILNAEISSTGKFIMSADKDTQIIIWSLKGDLDTCVFLFMHEGHISMYGFVGYINLTCKQFLGNVR